MKETWDKQETLKERYCRSVLLWIQFMVMARCRYRLYSQCFEDPYCLSSWLTLTLVRTEAYISLWDKKTYDSVVVVDLC